jgi:hypothetical protein
MARTKTIDVRPILTSLLPTERLEQLAAEAKALYEGDGVLVHERARSDPRPWGFRGGGALGFAVHAGGRAG